MRLNITWNGDKAMEQIKALAMEKAERVARFLAAAIKDEISVFSPPVSLPGQPPGMRTSNLRDSVSWTSNKQAGTCAVTVSAEYAGYLEKGTYRMAARPFVEATLKKHVAKIRAFLASR